MRKNILMLLTGCLAAMTVSASNIHHNTDSIYKQNTFSQEQMLLPMNPTYLKNVSEAANWGRNWFIEIKGGASAFLGSPIGCGDVFDRDNTCLEGRCWKVVHTRNRWTCRFPGTDVQER